VSGSSESKVALSSPLFGSNANSISTWKSLPFSVTGSSVRKSWLPAGTGTRGLPKPASVNSSVDQSRVEESWSVTPPCCAGAVGWRGGGVGVVLEVDAVGQDAGVGDEVCGADAGRAGLGVRIDRPRRRRRLGLRRLVRTGRDVGRLRGRGRPPGGSRIGRGSR